MRPTCPIAPSLLLLPTFLLACATAPSVPAIQDSPAAPAFPPTVEHWGAMREVLRDGHTQGRVSLADVVGPHTIAVGALAGLAAEITIDAGTGHLAEVVDPDLPDGLHIRRPAPADQATLLVLANVSEWSEFSLPELHDLAGLESAVRARAETTGIDVTKPFPFRVEGMASELHLHVLNHCCPIADPDGPKPWTFSGTETQAVLIGFYAEGAAGTLTHHGQSSHVHAILTNPNVSGHLDDVSLQHAARLFLPQHWQHSTATP